MTSISRAGSRRRCVVKLAIGLALVLGTPSVAADNQQENSLPQWTEGLLDIYHINTGLGNATYFILPDGTTMLVDAGDLDAGPFGVRASPLKLVPRSPSASLTAGQAIAQFIQQVTPDEGKARIDYALITHFHSDHYGAWRDGLSRSKFGSYELTGITEVGESIPIGVILDRAYPNYDLPVDLRKEHGRSLANYLLFQDAQKAARSTRVEQLRAGVNDQIVLLRDPQKFPLFSIRNAKSNHQIWTGNGKGVEDLFDPAVMVDGKGKFNENPLSLAIVVGYGDFDYFTGGDNTGLSGPGIPAWFDVETPLGDAIREVDVLVLNHHGNRDATNESFLRNLAPRVIVQQAWTSDQPGGEVLHRMISKAIWPGARDIFATSMVEETKVAIGPWMTQSYASFRGHVLVRVQPGGERYDVYVLDDAGFPQRVKGHFGPYAARARPIE